MSPRVSSRRSWAPTHRRSRSGPSAVPQAAQAVGACGTSALVTIGWERQNPFAPGGLLRVRLAGALGRGGGSLACVAVRAQLAAHLSPIGTVAGRRTGTGLGV